MVWGRDDECMLSSTLRGRVSGLVELVAAAAASAAAAPLTRSTRAVNRDPAAPPHFSLHIYIYSYWGYGKGITLFLCGLDLGPEAMASFADLLNPRSKPSSPSSSPAPSAGRAHFDPARDEARSSSGAGADQVGQSGHGEHRIGESGADRDVEGSWQPPRRSSMNISQLLSPTNVVASLAPAGGDEGRDLSPEEDAERQTLQNNEAAQSAGTKRKRASQAHAHKAARSQDQESHTEDAMSAQTLAQETNSGSPSSQPLEGSSDHARAGAQLSPTDMHAQRPNEYVPSLAPPKKKAKNWGAGGPNRQPSSSIPPSQLDQQSAEADAAQTLASVGTAATAERSAETAEPSVHESSEVVRLSPGSQASEYAPHSSREQQAMPIPAPRSISYISHGSPAHESSSTSGIPTGSQEPEVPKTKRKHPNQHTYRKKSQEAVQQPESAAATQSPSSNRSPVQQSPAVSGEGTSAPPKPKHPNQYTYRKKETIANSPAEDGGNRSPGSSTASAPSGTTDAPGAPGATKGKSAASEGAGKSESGASKPKHPNQWTYRKKDDPSRPKQPNQYTYRNKERETSASANGAGSSSSSKKSRAEREASVASSNDQGPSASPSSSTMKVENESGTAAATPQKRKQPNQYTYRNKEAKAGDEASPVTEAAPPKKKHANQYTKAAAAAAAAAEDAAAPPKPKHPNQWTYRNKDKEREASASSAGGDGGDSPAPPSKPKHPNQYTYRSKGSSEASEVSARAAAEKEKRERREEAERRRREEEEERQRREEEEAEKERRLREGEEEDKLYCICKTLYGKSVALRCIITKFATATDNFLLSESQMTRR